VSDKLALILSGGGMTCSFSVGVINALVREFGVTNPDIVIAASGSSGTMAYYIAGQFGSITNIWTNLLPSKKFINHFRFWKIIDIDYLIDEVFKKQDPLDIEKVYTSNIEFLIPATNDETGEVKYFSNRDDDDIFEAMRAAKAMPLAFNKRVKINGSTYCDSPLTSVTQLHIAKAIELGATRILVIENPPLDWLTKFGFRCWLMFRKGIFKKNYRALELKGKNSSVPKDISLLHLVPQEKLKITTLNNNQSLLRESIDVGYVTCKGSTRVKEFFNGT